MHGNYVMIGMMSDNAMLDVGSFSQGYKQQDRPVQASRLGEPCPGD